MVVSDADIRADINYQILSPGKMISLDIGYLPRYRILDILGHHLGTSPDIGICLHPSHLDADIVHEKWISAVDIGYLISYALKMLEKPLSFF